MNIKSCCGFVWLLLFGLIIHCNGQQNGNDVQGEWKAIPLVTQSIRDHGFTGGEGGQVPKAMAIDPIDGKFLLFGTDVGGIARSINGGDTWEPANIGYNARGNSGFSIDPNNINHVLAVGVNTINDNFNGIYLSEDMARTWRQVLSVNMCGLNDIGEQIAFDESSYSGKDKKSQFAYWSRTDEDACAWETGKAEHKGGLYRSKDGGLTWSYIDGSEIITGSIIKIHSAKGFVYAANKKGLFKSSNHGDTFVKIFDGEVTGLDVVRTHPDKVFILTQKGLFISHDAGDHFEEVVSKNFPMQNPVWLKVSPANINNMILQETSTEWFYKSKSYSRDGGVTWGETRLENLNPLEKINQYLPYNNGRIGYAVWHPTKEKLLFTWSTDWSAKSTDGGNSLQWNHDGLTGVMTGGFFNFSTSNSDILLLPTQDYDTHLTLNRGQTWKYLDLSRNNWGGFIYGGYSTDGNTIIAGLASSWGSKRVIAVSHDGGKTVEHTDIEVGFRNSALSDPQNARVLFIGNQRSSDNGYKWNKMAGCEGVYAYNNDPKAKSQLFGVSGNTAVQSLNSGESWYPLVSVSGEIRDLAYNYKSGNLFLACGDKLYSFSLPEQKLNDITNMVPPDQKGNHIFNTVAVDPADPSVIYVGGSGNTYSTDVAVVQSTDGGLHWRSLTLSNRLKNHLNGVDGGHEATCLRVHPGTRELYVGTNCYGLWKFIPDFKQSNVIKH